MVLILMIAAIFAALVIQKAMSDQGIEPLSRGQSRYLRRKARKLGVDVSQVPYRPRKGTHPFPNNIVSTDPEVRELEIDRAYAKRGQLSPALQEMMENQPHSLVFQTRMTMCGLGHLLPPSPAKPELTQREKDAQWTLAKAGYTRPGFPTLKELEERDGPRPE